MADDTERWTGEGSKSPSRSRGDREDSRRNRSPPRASPEQERRRGGGDDRRRHHRRSRSRSKERRSRSRSRGRRDRDHRRERSPPRRRHDRSPPSRGGHRSSSRSPPRRHDRSPPGRGGRRSSSRSPPRRHDRSPPRRGDNGGPGGRQRESRWSPPPPQQQHQPYGRGPLPPPPYFPPPGGRGFRPPPPSLSDVPPEVGSIHHARVASVRPFGAFVELPGFRKQALVHHSQVSDEIHFGREDDDEMKVKAMEFFLPQGEKVWVKILEVRQEPGGPAKLAASMRAVNQEDGTDLDPDNTLAAGGRGGPGAPGGMGGGGHGGRDSDEPPELYSIHRAAVQQVRPFGVFVKLDGYRKYGLVHFSQISDHLSFSREDSDDVKMKEIGEIMSVGDPVWVKVVDLTFDERGPKIGCSIKHVSQSDGTDLDPANTKYRPRGEGGGFQSQKPIGATAGTTTQDGAVDWGHLKADVVQYGKGGEQYEILADSGDEGKGPLGPGRGPPMPPQRPGAPGAPGGGGGTGANMAPMPPRGRGSGAVLPAWMTGGGDGAAAAAPGSAPPPTAAAAAPPGGFGEGLQHITSVEQALAILEEHARSKKEKRKKHKKEKKSKHKKEKKEKRGKEKRRAHKDPHGGSGSDSSSSSDSD